MKKFPKIEAVKVHDGVSIKFQYGSNQQYAYMVACIMEAFLKNEAGDGNLNNGFDFFVKALAHMATKLSDEFDQKIELYETDEEEEEEEEEPDVEQMLNDAKDTLSELLEDLEESLKKRKEKKNG